jgi:uncharacterized protein YjhX (UPF0386 family)
VGRSEMIVLEEIIKDGKIAEKTESNGIIIESSCFTFDSTP